MNEDAALRGGQRNDALRLLEHIDTENLGQEICERTCRPALEGGRRETVPFLVERAPQPGARVFRRKHPVVRSEQGRSPALANEPRSAREEGPARRNPGPRAGGPRRFVCVLVRARELDAPLGGRSPGDALDPAIPDAPVRIETGEPEKERRYPFLPRALLEARIAHAEMLAGGFHREGEKQRFLAQPVGLARERDRAPRGALELNAVGVGEKGILGRGPREDTLGESGYEHRPESETPRLAEREHAHGAGAETAAGRSRAVEGGLRRPVKPRRRCRDAEGVELSERLDDPACLFDRFAVIEQRMGESGELAGEGRPRRKGADIFAHAGDGAQEHVRVRDGGETPPSRFPFFDRGRDARGEGFVFLYPAALADHARLGAVTNPESEMIRDGVGRV